MSALPARTREEVHGEWPALRQSILAHFDQCPLAVRFSLEGHDPTGPEAARGIVFHKFAELYLAELRERGERNMPVAETLEVLYEAESQVRVDDEEHVHVPAHERETLRIAAIQFCKHALSVERIVAIEERLFARVAYTDTAGDRVERTVTGQPDCLIADPGRMGVIVPDWKTTRSPPPRPATNGGDDPLSSEGYFQQRLYALLIFRNYEKVETVTLREYYPLAGESREATMERWQLEHAEREVSLAVQELDRALEGGHASPLWRAQPGRHCRYCPRPTECPVDLADRFPAAPLDDEQAQLMAGAFLVVDRQRSWLREAVREHVSQHGPIDVKNDKGRFQLRWKVHPETGRRNFGLWPAEEQR